MLARGAIRYARFAVLVQNELIRALALVRSDSRLAVSFEQIRTGGWCDETEMRTAAVILRAGIVEGQLPKWMIRVNVVRPMSGVAQHLPMSTGELFRSTDGL